MKIKILTALHAGYCMGVKRAFDQSAALANQFNHISMYGEIVHNRFALQSLYEKGIRLQNDLDALLNDPLIDNIIIRAHGIPPDQEERIRKSRKIIYDYTCPKVKQVQLLAHKLTSTGYTIILFGKPTHPEIIGIVGYCRQASYVIKNLDEARQLKLDPTGKLALLSQTTMNSAMFNEICNYLKNKYDKLEIFNTLCNAPVKIQDSALKLAEKVDAFIVVGDKMSANTTTLYEKIKMVKPCWFVETPTDLNLDEIKNYSILGITGGSSTPLWQIKSIINFIKKN